MVAIPRGCVKCGVLLVRTGTGHRFCPNHGIIEENQDWNRDNDSIKKNEKEKKK